MNCWIKVPTTQMSVFVFFLSAWVNLFQSFFSLWLSLRTRSMKIMPKDNIPINLLRSNIYLFLRSYTQSLTNSIKSYLFRWKWYIASENTIGLIIQITDKIAFNPILPRFPSLFLTDFLTTYTQLLCLPWVLVKYHQA